MLNPDIIIEHRESSGVGGGTYAIGVDLQKQKLNTIVRDTNSEVVSLASDEFVLAAGTYLCEFYSTSYEPTTSRGAIVNETQGSRELTAVNATASSAHSALSMGIGKIISNGTDSFSLTVYQNSTTGTADARGKAVSQVGVDEIYQRLCIKRLTVNPQYSFDIHMQHRETVGVDGGAYAGSALEGLIVNSIQKDANSNIVSLSSSAFQLDGGVYDFEFWTQIKGQGYFKTFLYDATDALVVIPSMNGFSNQQASGPSCYSYGVGRVTIDPSHLYTFAKYSTAPNTDAYARGRSVNNILFSPNPDEVYQNYYAKKVS